MGRENHVGGSLLQMLGWYWMNKLAVTSVNKACWPQFPFGVFHCVVSWVFCGFFLKVVFGPKCTMHPVISLKRHRNAHRNAPQSVCWHSWPLRSQMLTKTFCWGSLSSLPGDTRLAVGLSRRISRHFRSEWKLGALLLKVASWPGYLIWKLKSISAVFRLLSFFSFKLQALPSGWMENDHWVFFFFFFTPFHLHLGDHEMFLSPRLLWDVTAGFIQREIGCN